MRTFPALFVLLFLFVTGEPAFSQRVSIGVTGGVPLSRALGVTGISGAQTGQPQVPFCAL
jgi:hypothetical protein